jgi:uncharacterized membrane protein
MEFVVLIHVLAGATWFGGHVYVESLMAAAGRTGDPERIATVGLGAVKTNGRLFGAAGTIALLTGIWIVLATEAYEFENLFVSLGIILTVAALIYGLAVLKPREEALDELAAEKGLTDPVFIAELKKTAGLGRAMTLGVTIIIIVMVLKPGL